MKEQSDILPSWRLTKKYKQCKQNIEDSLWPWLEEESDEEMREHSAKEELNDAKKPCRRIREMN